MQPSISVGGAADVSRAGYIARTAMWAIIEEGGGSHLTTAYAAAVACGGRSRRRLAGEGTAVLTSAELDQIYNAGASEAGDLAAMDPPATMLYTLRDYQKQVGRRTADVARRMAPLTREKKESPEVL